jgi:hypothetical protein
MFVVSERKRPGNDQFHPEMPFDCGLVNSDLHLAIRGEGTLLLAEEQPAHAPKVLVRVEKMHRELSGEVPVKSLYTAMVHVARVQRKARTKLSSNELRAPVMPELQKPSGLGTQAILRGAHLPNRRRDRADPGKTLTLRRFLLEIAIAKQHIFAVGTAISAISSKRLKLPFEIV